MNSEYIFRSNRLGFRNWTDGDLPDFARLNADAEVMEHFPNTLTEQETADFIVRLKKHFIKHGFNYFAVEVLETGEFIGFIGLAYQDYQSPFTPAVDMGWRLIKSAWGKGFATEGARRCLEYAFTELHLNRLISTCTEKNAKSEKVMKKIGMEKSGHFLHPKLRDYPEYENCICYEINKERWQELSML